MPTQRSERDILEQDPYAQLRGRINSVTQRARAAIDHFNSSLVGINGDLQAAHDGRREIIDAENEARKIRAELGFKELVRRGLDFCSGSHAEIIGEGESLSEDEKLRKLGAIPSTELTPIAYQFATDPNGGIQAALFCGEHTELEPQVSTVDLTQLTQEALHDLLAKRTQFAFETFRGMTILDALGIPALELSQGAKDIKQAVHPESSVPHEIWPILPTISGNPRDVIARHKPEPTTKPTS